MINCTLVLICPNEYVDAPQAIYINDELVYESDHRLDKHIKKQMLEYIGEKFAYEHHIIKAHKYLITKDSLPFPKSLTELVDYVEL